MISIKNNSSDWNVEILSGKKQLRRSKNNFNDFPHQYLTEGISDVAEVFEANSSKKMTRGTSFNNLDLTYTAGDNESVVLVIRQASGSLSFHQAISQEIRSTKKKTESKYRFIVPMTAKYEHRLKRSLFSKVIGYIVKIVVDRAASFFLPKLTRVFEEKSWKKKGLKEGWYKVEQQTLLRNELVPRVPKSLKRTLLLIHGTFSDAGAAFGDLARTSFFDSIKSVYEDRIYAFNHYSLSKTPAENALDLLNGLPDKTIEFDVITHSRGALVLRQITERSTSFGSLSNRFKLRHAVLVAAPNNGTPLASPERWQDTVGWMANILEIFPENPFTIAAEFVANGLVWLANHASGDIPGLNAMNPKGENIQVIQEPPHLRDDAYSALVSNYQAEGNILIRLLDAGFDGFFKGANDLVVPSEGGWQTAKEKKITIPATQIGCFGLGGNLSQYDVTHIDFFSQPETVDFLRNALHGKTHSIVPIDPQVVLATKSRMRTIEHAQIGSTKLPSIRPNKDLKEFEIQSKELLTDSDSFYLTVIPYEGAIKDERNDSSSISRAKVLARYGSARVLSEFRLRGGTAGKRWQAIIARNEQIKTYIDINHGAMPSKKELMEFGLLLFDMLLEQDVLRLYDTARSQHRGKMLNFVFTSMIPWVASKPWEFAYDPIRKTYLATEEIHFIRNTLTAVPAERTRPRDRLNILVIAAQPLRAGRLSIEAEVEVIKRGFEPLIQAGLATIEVLAQATPSMLHSHVSSGQYSIVHFIGHGDYDRELEEGYLVFVDANGNPHRVNQRSIREILCQRGIDLVFLNACETGVDGVVDFNSGVAPALMANGMPIVVANQYKVLDVSATFFAQHFYWSLAQGATVGESTREARIAVNYSMLGEGIDWAVPVVYARNPDTRLSVASLRSSADINVSPMINQESRKAILQHKIKVSIWDMNYQFPKLEQTINRLNRAQSYFGFEIVDLTLPVDTWDIHKDDGKDTRYLHAEKFANRLGPHVSQLSTNYLFTIVDEWMQDSETLNIYGWWPDKSAPPVLIFSTKGLVFDPIDASSKRVLPNILVTCILGYLLNSGTHASGPKKCPNFLDPERDVNLLMSHNKICARCNNKTDKIFQTEKQSEHLKISLRSILNIFDSSEDRTRQ